MSQCGWKTKNKKPSLKQTAADCSNKWDEAIDVTESSDAWSAVLPSRTI